MTRLTKSLIVVGGVVATIAVLSESRYLTGPVVFRTHFAHALVNEHAPVMRLSCDLPPDGHYWERALYQGGPFYDLILKDHPIGSSSDALLRDVKSQRYRVTECGNGYHAQASVSQSFMMQADAEIAWIRSPDGRIAKIGVQYGLTGP